MLIAHWKEYSSTPVKVESDSRMRFSQDFQVVLLVLVAQSAGNGGTRAGFRGGGMGVVWKGARACIKLGGG